MIKLFSSDYPAVNSGSNKLSDASISFSFSLPKFFERFAQHVCSHPFYTHIKFLKETCRLICIDRAIVHLRLSLSHVEMRRQPGRITSEINCCGDIGGSLNYKKYSEQRKKLRM